MTVAVLTRDLMIASRIIDAGSRAGTTVVRVEAPDALPPPGSLRLLFVDWGNRAADWAARLPKWCADAPESERPRLVLFGPHTDLAAHAEARAAGLGPMLARSRLIAELPRLLRAVD